jgi:hypothetical protein
VFFHLLFSETKEKRHAERKKQEGRKEGGRKGNELAGQREKTRG